MFFSDFKKYKKTLLFGFLLWGTICNNAMALSCKPDVKCESSAAVVLLPAVLFETLVLGGSTWAAYSPSTAAIGNAVVGLMLKPRELNELFAFFEILGLAGYNIYRSTDYDRHRPEIFLVNFVGWHLVLGTYVSDIGHNKRFHNVALLPNLNPVTNTVLVSAEIKF